MGTTWHVSYVEPQKKPAPEDLERAIGDLLESINQEMSTYLPESQISRFNRFGTNAWFQTTPAFFEVLTMALEVGRHSEGAYDITVAPLVDLWGFGPGKQVFSPPSQEDIDVLMPRIGQDNIRLDREHYGVMKLSELSLDVSSLAKGYAVDQVADLLLEQGINRFMVEVGGEIRLSGLSGRGDAWRIAIERPDSAGRSVDAAISLTDVAVATSGDYRNYFEVNGERYSHMIDPRTGHPISHDLVSVTVVHPECMIADAWATALAVLGAERAMSVAQEHELAVYFIRRVGDELVHSHTPMFAGYLEAPDI